MIPIMNKKVALRLELLYDWRVALLVWCVFTRSSYFISAQGSPMAMAHVSKCVAELVMRAFWQWIHIGVGFHQSRFASSIRPHKERGQNKILVS